MTSLHTAQACRIGVTRCGFHNCDKVLRGMPDEPGSAVYVCPLCVQELAIGLKLPPARFVEVRARDEVFPVSVGRVQIAGGGYSLVVHNRVSSVVYPTPLEAVCALLAGFGWVSSFWDEDGTLRIDKGPNDEPYVQGGYTNNNDVCSREG